MRGACSEIGDDPAGQLLRRGHDVGQPRVDGAPGHAVEFGRLRRLDEDHPGLLLDRPKAQRAVGAHPREDDADALVLPVVRQGAEEEIDRQAEPPGGRRIEQVQRPMEDGHVLVGGDHVDPVRFDLHAVPDLDDLHGGGALEELHHDPLVGRVEVLDDDEGHAASRGHVLQEELQRLETAGGGADADDGKRAVRVAAAPLRWRTFPPGRSRQVLYACLPAPDRFFMVQLFLIVRCAIDQERNPQTLPCGRELHKTIEGLPRCDGAMVDFFRCSRASGRYHESSYLHQVGVFCGFCPSFSFVTTRVRIHPAMIDSKLFFHSV